MRNRRPGKNRDHEKGRKEERVSDMLFSDRLVLRYAVSDMLVKV